MTIKESGEMYLETIYVLRLENEFVRSIDVAEKMSFSKPSVSRGVNILKKEGYLIIEDNGNLVLTDIGYKLARKIYERHIILTKMLISFGVDEKTASNDACRMEHGISDDSLEAIKNSLHLS